MNTDGGNTAFVREELSALAPDLKRMLRVQLKELVIWLKMFNTRTTKPSFPILVNLSSTATALHITLRS